MIRFLIISLLCCLSHFISAQPVNINWGSANEKPRKSYIEKIIGRDDQWFYVLRFKDGGWFGKDKWFLEKFESGSLQLKTTTELIFPLLNGRAIEYEDLFYSGGKFTFFVSQIDYSAHQKITYALQTNDLTSIKETFIPLDTIFNAKRSNPEDVNIVQDPSAKYFLICHNDNYQSYNNEFLEYKVVNADLKQEYKKQIRLPYKDKAFFISNYLINGLGDVYLLAKVVDDGKRWKKGRPNFIYAVMRLSRNDPEYKEFDVNLGNRSVSDINFKLAQDGDLVVGGFYSNRARTEEEMGGLFFFRLDKFTNQITSKVVRDFDTEFLSLFMKERNVSRGGELFDYNIDYILTDTESNTYILAEQYFMDQICRTDFRTGIQTCTYYYNYNDIIAIKINKEGNIVWTKKVPKRQVTVNDGGPYSSYIAFLDNNRLHFIYNDSYRNNNLRQGDRMYTMNNPKRSIAVDLVIDENGKMTRTTLFNSRDRKTIIRPKLNRQIALEDQIMYGQSSSKYMLGKITFNR